MTHFRLALPAQSPQDAKGSAKAILENSKATMGMIPNMYANMANSPGLLTTYIGGYYHFRESSGFTPGDKAVARVDWMDSASLVCISTQDTQTNHR